MDEFVLRGFCEKCEQSITWDYFNENDKTKFYQGNCNAKLVNGKYGKCSPVWFLSAKQMKIVGESEKWGDWLDSLDKYDDWPDLIQFIQENPFLVARILKEAGEKKDGGGLDGGR